MSVFDASVFDATEAAPDELRRIAQFAFLRRPLAALLEACADASLDLIVLKGAALAETVYPRVTLRPFGDLDVLVRAEDAPKARLLLLELGYVCDVAAWEDLAQGRSCEANFFRHTELGTVVVELHTDLLNNPLLRRAVHVDLGGLWTRSLPACLAGREARVLGPEDQLLHLCLHLAGHYFDPSYSRRDIAQVCAVRAVDWPLLLSLCRCAHAETIGYSGLFVAAAGYGASVPLSVFTSLAPRFGRRSLESLLIAQAEPGRSEVRRFLLLWLLLGSDGARFNAVCRLFFPTAAWLHTHYFYALPAAPAARRLPLGIRLYAAHLKFLARAAAGRGRK